jgi:predicted NBD/HSP70 family sugar kinase
MSRRSSISADGTRRQALNPAFIRQLNLSRLFHALRDSPGSSQRELVKRTGVDKATVSAIIAQLEASGLITRSPRPGVRRVGRPEIALHISSEAGILVGARLEPSTIRLVATSLDGRVLKTLQVAGSRDIDKALFLLQEAAEALIQGCGFAEEAVRGMGVGVPALMDLSGSLVLAPNLGWRDVAILPRLKEAFNFPVYVDNDTKAAALAEKLFGSCRDVADFIYITGHSGVGGGLYLGGRLYRGASGFAGEIGHVKIVSGGRPCGCGGRGCLEAYVSESSILARLADREVVLKDVWEIAERAQAGDERVLEILVETGSYLGFAVGNLINLANPERVVLGGNLAVVADDLLPAMTEAIANSALEPSRKGVEIIISPLGAESVPMGGVALALEAFLAAPAGF